MLFTHPNLLSITDISIPGRYMSSLSQRILSLSIVAVVVDMFCTDGVYPPGMDRGDSDEQTAKDPHKFREDH